MNQINRKSRHIDSQKIFPVDGIGHHNKRSRIHNSPIDKHGCQKTKDAQRHPSGLKPSFLEQNARQKTDDSHGKHLPGRPWALPEKHIGSKHTDCSHQKSGFCAKAYRSNDHNGCYRFKTWHHKKCRPSRHCNGSQNRDD